MNRIELAELVLEQHRGIAFSDDAQIATSGLPIYDNSLALLLATIKIAYPDVDTVAVYEIWCDCNESVAYCVKIWRDQQFACGDSNCKGDCKIGYFLFLDDNERDLEICLTFHTQSEYQEMRKWLDVRMPAEFTLSGDC